VFVGIGTTVSLRSFQPKQRMPTRRQFIWSTAGISAGAIAIVAVDAWLSKNRYEAATRALWRDPVTRAIGLTAVHHALVRAATLAPSSHNTQCWKFGLAPDAITILPDLSRRCPAVDPDDHHLYVSLGCAAENIVQAAAANGLRAIGAPAARDVGYRLQLSPDTSSASPLAAAITSRQSARNVYDGRALTQSELIALERAGTSERVSLMLLTERPAVNSILDAVVSANAAQMQDVAFVAELRQWIRFSNREALDHRDGLFSATTGNPSIPRWIGEAMFGMVFTEKGETAKYVEQIRSSAGIAVFVGAESDPAHWMEVGRCFERFALQCTVLGISTAMINQPVEVSSARSQFAAHLGLGRQRPDLVVRFGRGSAMARSLRRPVSAVIV